MTPKDSSPNSASKDVIITYDTVFDMLRNEKTREELQPLSPTLFKDLVAYLNEKREFLEKQDKTNPFADAEIKKTAQQLENIYRMLRELYDRRERKIIMMALNKARIPAGIINTAALLEEEKILFDSLVELLSGLRRDVLIRVLEGKEPEITLHHRENYKEAEKYQQASSELESIKKELMQKAEEHSNNAAHSCITEHARDQTIGRATEHAGEHKVSKLVRFLNAVPRFVGQELEVYGPFEEDDIASLPAELADVIIKKGRAEEIQEEDGK